MTTLRKSISIAKDAKDSCEIYALIKIRNKRNYYVNERKTFILIFVLIDICESLLTSRLRHQYFLKIVDNHSRKTWVITLVKREQAIDALRKWKLQVELKSSAKLLVVRSDNATKLKSIFDEWCSSFGIVLNYTLSYNFL